MKCACQHVEPDTAAYPMAVSQIYATATHLSTGEVVRTLGPFETLHAARAAVVEAVGQVLLWERQRPGTFVAEKYPLLWKVEEQATIQAQDRVGRRPESD